MFFFVHPVLELVPEDVTAKQCKLVALIHLGELEKAHEYANKKNGGLSTLPDGQGL